MDRTYAITSTTLILRDAPEETPLYDLPFHLHAGDFFGMASQALALISDQYPSSMQESTSFQLLEQLRRDFALLHRTHRIVPKASR